MIKQLIYNLLVRYRNWSKRNDHIYNQLENLGREVNSDRR